MADHVRVKAVLAYDGAAFHGFAATPGVETVAGVLRGALERVLRHDVELVGAGRTDAGVHAWGQVVSFDVDRDRFDPTGLQRSVNGLCGPALVLRSLEEADPDFHARFSANWRRYRYTVATGAVGNPFLARTAWYVDRDLDLDALRLGVDPFIGEHDFTSFCRRPDTGPDETPPSLVRRVLDAHWDDLGEGVLRFEVRGESFCHNQVRAMVGTLVDVGLGRRHAGELTGIIRARDRGRAGPVAPPHGLCLWEVGY